MKIVVADGLAPEGVERLRASAEVAVHRGLAPEALRREIADADALVVRSATRVDREAIEAAPRLRVIARAGVGIDNVDVDAATRRGVLVINTPEGSTVSTAEHAMALLLALARRVPAAHASTAAGGWQRERFVGTELYGKILGVIGLGKVGAEVAARAAAFGMRVLAYDPYVSADRAVRAGADLVPLDAVLEHSEVVTLHLPLTPSTRHLIGAPELARMRRGVLIVNAARGGLIDEAALLAALDEGTVAGAALDVFEHEPPGDSPLLRHPRVVVTPHLGASTEEAQRAIASDVAAQVLAALEGRPVRGAINIPALREDAWDRLRPFVELMRILGAVARQLVRGQVREVAFTYEGEVAAEPTEPLGSAFLTGLLEAISDQPVNVVNAAVVARERGIGLSDRRRDECEDFSSLVRVRLETDAGPFVLGGTLFGRREPRITHVGAYRVDLPPAPHILFVWNEDIPGMIGEVGTILGRHRINIAGMQVGREQPGGVAVMVLTVDSAVPEAAVAEIRGVRGISDVQRVDV